MAEADFGDNIKSRYPYFFLLNLNLDHPKYLHFDHNYYCYNIHIKESSCRIFISVSELYCLVKKK